METEFFQGRFRGKKKKKGRERERERGVIDGDEPGRSGQWESVVDDDDDCDMFFCLWGIGQGWL